MTRKSRLSKLEQARPTPQAFQVTITRHIIDRAQGGELHTVKTEERTFTVVTLEGMK